MSLEIGVEVASGSDAGVFSHGENAREMEAIEKPFVIAHHATCVGGGLEMSLSCDFRLAADSPGKGAGPGRPITFAFNGGPGSSSLWLHMGVLGPKRVVVSDPTPTPVVGTQDTHTLTIDPPQPAQTP